MPSHRNTPPAISRNSSVEFGPVVGGHISQVITLLMFFIVLPPYSGKQFLSGPHRARARWRTAQAFFYSPGLQPFIPAEFVRLRRNKSRVRWFNLMWMPGAGRQSESFEELAMPLFDQLYNFAHWLTQDREEAEDRAEE